MGREIERKFLVDAQRWRPAGAGVAIRQGYLSSHPERTVRVRLEGEAGTLTIKGLTTGISRAEYEYPIPAADAAALLALCERPLIEKVRHAEEHAGRAWTIDVFDGDNAGLVLAEIELTAEDEAVEVPPWASAEVSHDPRYYNANLARSPYRAWAATPAGGAARS